MGKRKWVFLIMGLMVILILAAGCGPGANQLAEEKTFTYAMSGQYRPFNYFDENKQLTGFDVEIGRALAEKMGMEPRPIATPWQGLISGLKAKKYDTPFWAV